MWISQVLEISLKILNKDSKSSNHFPDNIYRIAYIKTVKEKLIQIPLSISLKKGTG